MNTACICGTLKKEGSVHAQGYLYHLEVRRKSNVIDTLLLFGGKDLPEGIVQVDGHLAAGRVADCGFPPYIMADKVAPSSNDTYSDASAEGILKKDPEIHKTPGGWHVCTVLLLTDDGPIPVVFWNKTADLVADSLQAGDRIKVKGRMQSRTYPKKGTEEFRLAWELSATGFEYVPEECMEALPAE